MDNHLLADIVEWDVRNWSRAIEFWDRAVDWSRVETCLEVGGGRGGLSLWLAMKGKRVVCSDLHDVRRAAVAHHGKYKLDARIDYQDIDATRIPYENHFDIVAFKSVLGGIARQGGKPIQQTVIDQIHKALKPGGKLLFAENLVASPLHRVVRERFVRWGRDWRYVTLQEMNEFLRNYSPKELRATGVLGAFGRTEGQRRFLGAVDQRFLNYVTPKRWKYIVYGTAEK
ncbi:MAG: methyltransferase domain-containing protein [Pirellulales bacterium]